MCMFVGMCVYVFVNKVCMTVSCVIAHPVTNSVFILHIIGLQHFIHNLYALP